MNKTDSAKNTKFFLAEASIGFNKEANSAYMKMRSCWPWVRAAGRREYRAWNLAEQVANRAITLLSDLP